MLRKLVLILVVASLAACQTTNSSNNQTAASAKSSVIAATGVDAVFEDFINIRNRNSSGDTKPLAFALRVCKAIIPGQTNMRDIIEKFGLPDFWNNNYGEIESAGWPAQITASGGSLVVFYTRDGRIRNVTGFANGSGFKFGASQTTAPNSWCVPRA